MQAEVQQLAERVAARIERVLRKHGRYLDEHGIAGVEQDACGTEPSALSACYQAAATGQQRFGPCAGKPALRLLATAPVRSASKHKSGLLGEARGVNIHASLPVHGRDKPQLEHNPKPSAATRTTVAL